MIRKLPKQRKYRVYSKKKVRVKGKGWVHKNMGTYKTIKDALNREQQIRFFKHK